jgi:hypothetical protein
MLPAPDRSLTAHLGALSLVMAALLFAGCQQVIDRLAVDTGWAARDAASVQNEPAPTLAPNPSIAPAPAPTPELPAQKPASAATVSRAEGSRGNIPKINSRSAISPDSTSRLDPPQRKAPAQVSAPQAPSTASTPAMPTGVTSKAAPSKTAPSNPAVWSTAPQPTRPAQLQPTNPSTPATQRPVPVYIED